MNPEEAAQQLGVDPSLLTAAPPAPRFAETWARIQQEPPCSACGQPSRTSSVIHAPPHGPRWFDRCRDCFIATPPTLPGPPSQLVEDLREVAAEARLRLRVHTRENGWRDEL